VIGPPVRSFGRLADYPIEFPEGKAALGSDIQPELYREGQGQIFSPD